MKETNEILPGKLTKRGQRFKNKDFTVFVFFLFLSFLFWYLNSLGKEIEADIRYPLNFVNIPKGRAIVEEQPVKINLSLKGSGYSILKLKLTGRRKPFIIDVSEISLKRIPGTRGLNYFIVTSGISKSLTTQLKSDCEITMIKPDTLFLTLGEMDVAPANQTRDNKVDTGGD